MAWEHPTSSRASRGSRARTHCTLYCRRCLNAEKARLERSNQCPMIRVPLALRVGTELDSADVYCTVLADGARRCSCTRSTHAAHTHHTHTHAHPNCTARHVGCTAVGRSDAKGGPASSDVRWAVAVCGAPTQRTHITHTLEQLQGG